MKIVPRAELITMPKGTLFAEVLENGTYSYLCIFGGYGTGPDFIERSIMAPESTGTEEYLERLEAMREQGASFPVNEDYGREGLFDDNLKYLVFEPADIASIIADIAPAMRRDQEDRP